MAIIQSCCGCGLAVSSAVLGVYLLVAYSIAFAIELWWILESPATPPIPAHLLCLGYFILLIFSILLLHGLSVKRTTFLLIWLFMMGILLGPEAGLVLYLSIHYWRITSMYGLIEVTCWACRLVVNVDSYHKHIPLCSQSSGLFHHLPITLTNCAVVFSFVFSSTIGLLCVQSLHSIWREEKSVLLRLETLKTGSLSKAPLRQLSNSAFRGYKNGGYEQTVLHGEMPLKGLPEKANADLYDRFQPPHNGIIFKCEDQDGSYIDERYAGGNEFSEFNASSFDPTVIDARLENMPYLTIRKKPSKSAQLPELVSQDSDVISKTRSLIDFRDARFPDDGKVKHPNKQTSGPFSSLDVKNQDNSASNTNSLDRKIIKNKNLKILGRLSPFHRRKSVEMNIYQINPPKNFKPSDLDSQLNTVYSSRGMYAFDEKLKKLVYYPPEIFNKSLKFRSRMDSYGSSQSRSSVDTDYEDINQISDVAL